MKAMQVNKAGQRPVLILAELQKPEAGLGEILVHVHGAGCHSHRIALVSHDTYEIRNSARTRGARARIFGSHHGDRQRCPGFQGWRRGLRHERLVNEASAAYSGAVRDKGGYGKIVITVPA